MSEFILPRKHKVKKQLHACLFVLLVQLVADLFCYSSRRVLQSAFGFTALTIIYSYMSACFYFSGSNYLQELEYRETGIFWADYSLRDRMSRSKGCRCSGCSD